MRTVSLSPEPIWHPNPSPLSVLWAVLRRLAPQLVEATLIPSALCYLGVLTVGLMWGVVAAAVWTGLAVGRRLLSGRALSGLLVLAATGLVVRSALYLLNESSFMYFAQPIARTVATALLFAVSAVIGRPLVARFANDFCAFDADVGDRPAITALFRRLTFLWAGVQATTAVISLTLLLTVPVGVFIGAAAGAQWLVIAVGVFVTVRDSVRTTRRDGLHTALGTGGRLRAVLVPVS